MTKQLKQYLHKDMVLDEFAYENHLKDYELKCLLNLGEMGYTAEDGKWILINRITIDLPRVEEVTARLGLLHLFKKNLIDKILSPEDKRIPMIRLTQQGYELYKKALIEFTRR